MRNLVLLFIVVLVLSAFITPLQSGRPVSPTPVADGGVFPGNQLPPYGVICIDTPVYGSPHVGRVLYSVYKGDVVQLRELSKGVQGWVMIDKARWIPFDAVCDW